jgi:DNA gyrase subunit A
VKTVQLTEAKGQLAGARMVREGMHVMMISTGGTVIRMPAEEIKRLGRSTQGVIVMRLRGDEQVSTLALVAEGEPNGEEGDVLGVVSADGEVGSSNGAGAVVDEPELEPDLEPDADDEAE